MELMHKFLIYGAPKGTGEWKKINGREKKRIYLAVDNINNCDLTIWLILVLPLFFFSSHVSLGALY